MHGETSDMTSAYSVFGERMSPIKSVRCVSVIDVIEACCSWSATHLLSRSQTSQDYRHALYFREAHVKTNFLTFN